MNAGNENATRQGGALKTDYDTTNVTEASLKVNGIGQPPAGHAWEGGEIVPLAPPGEAVALSREQVLLRTIALACSWSQGEPVRWQSFMSVAGFDSRPLSEVAESLRVSPRLVQLRVAECKTWLAELRAELRGEAVPLKGEKP